LDLPHFAHAHGRSLLGHQPDEQELAVIEAGLDGKRTAWLAHPDGSWARATAIGQESPVVRQEGRA
jgi:hypothetical protein